MPRCGAILAAAGLGLALAAAPACSRAPRATPQTPNVLLVTIDTLRADHLGCYGYFRDTSPTIDALAAESIVFDRAYSPMATTLPAHVSLLTGLHPLEHGVLANLEHGGDGFRSRPGVRSAAELLRAEGYATAAFVSAAPLKRSSGIAAGFETFVEPREAQCGAGRTTEAALRWIETHADQRMFLWIHYYDPHWPRKPPEPYRSRYRDEPALARFLEERAIPAFVGEAPCKLATDTLEAHNAYDGAIRYADEHLGRVLRAFRDRDLLGTTVVVVTSDHGEGLNQHDWPAHGRVWEEQVRVPLLVRIPGETPRREPRLVSLLDVLPTVLAHTGLEAAVELARQATGGDVLAPGATERPVLAQRTGRECGDDAGPIFAWIAPRWKVVHQPPAEDLLFDLTVDPHELQGVGASHNGSKQALLEALSAAVAAGTARGLELRGAPGAHDDDIDPELLEQLESLGYVGGSAGSEAAE